MFAVLTLIDIEHKLIIWDLFPYASTIVKPKSKFKLKVVSQRFGLRLTL